MFSVLLIYLTCESGLDYSVQKNYSGISGIPQTFDDPDRMASTIKIFGGKDLPARILLLLFFFCSYDLTGIGISGPRLLHSLILMTPVSRHRSPTVITHSIP